MNDNKGNLLMLKKPYGIKELVGGDRIIEPPIVINSKGEKSYYLNKEHKFIKID